MMLRYKDADGKHYKLGDIVFNPCFGDFWVVQKCSREERKNYGLDNKYCLALYGNKDDYVIEINAPEGFVIAKREEDEDYKEAMLELNQISEERLKRYEEVEEDDKQRKDTECN